MVANIWRVALLLRYQSTGSTTCPGFRPAGREEADTLCWHRPSLSPIKWLSGAFGSGVDCKAGSAGGLTLGVMHLHGSAGRNGSQAAIAADSALGVPHLFGVGGQVRKVLITAHLERLVVADTLDGRIFTRGRELGLKDHSKVAIADDLALSTLHLFGLAGQKV